MSLNDTGDLIYARAAGKRACSTQRNPHPWRAQPGKTPCCLLRAWHGHFARSRLRALRTFPGEHRIEFCASWTA